MKFVLPAFGEYSPLKVHDSMLSTHFAFALLSAWRADINSCNNKSVEEAWYVANTEPENMACTWFGEICSCALNNSRNIFHQTTYKPYFRALYKA